MASDPQIVKVKRRRFVLSRKGVELVEARILAGDRDSEIIEALKAIGQKVTVDSLWYYRNRPDMRKLCADRRRSAHIGGLTDYVRNIETLEAHARQILTRLYPDGKPENGLYAMPVDCFHIYSKELRATLLQLREAVYGKDPQKVVTEISGPDGGAIVIERYDTLSPLVATMERLMAGIEEKKIREARAIEAQEPLVIEAAKEEGL